MTSEKLVTLFRDTMGRYVPKTNNLFWMPYFFIAASGPQQKAQASWGLSFPKQRAIKQTSGTRAAMRGLAGYRKSLFRTRSAHLEDLV